MRNLRIWAVFAVAALVSLIAHLCIAPSMSGTDVYIFRDAGWNLAAYGSFESAGLLYMRDLIPHFFAHYTPIQPLLFAAYAAVFPRNPYAGTVFDLLLGFLAAAVALRFVLRLPATRLRTLAALAVAAFPVVFVPDDRPETIALVLFCATVASVARPAAQPVVVGLLLALTFLAHPFAALAAAVWVAGLFLARGTEFRPWRRIALSGALALAVLAPVALLYFLLDRDSLARFAQHALGMHSGLGVVADSHKSFFDALHHSIIDPGRLMSWSYLVSLGAILLFVGWAVLRRERLSREDGCVVAAALAGALIALFLFPNQGNYVLFMAFAVALGLVIVGHTQPRLAAPGLAMLFFAVCTHLPSVALGLTVGIEQIPSFRAARQQPELLRAQLPSPEALVAVQGPEYDLFKPQFHHMVELGAAEDAGRDASVEAVANCYASSQAEAGEVLPLPVELDARQFRLIQPAPAHLWITLFGHRFMRKQWGYGCDLYLKNHRPGSPE